MTISQIASVQYAYRSFAANNIAANRNTNRLSSGYRINAAADDAAGLAVSEKIRGQIGGLVKSYENTQMATSLLQTAEGGMNSTTSILTRMRELSVQASNGVYSDSDRALINEEFQTLKGELDRTSSSTQYNGMHLLNGTLGGAKGLAGMEKLGVSGVTAGLGNVSDGDAKFTISQENGVYSVTAEFDGETITNTLGANDTATTFQFENGATLTMHFNNVADLKAGVIANVGVEAGKMSTDTTGAVSASSTAQLTFQIGANGSADQRVGLSIKDMSAFGLGVNDLNVSSRNSANNALSAIDEAINRVNSQRSNLGATQNRLEHTSKSLQTSHLNMSKSESTIRDLNYAKATMSRTQHRVQQQAAQSMMAQGMRFRRDYMMGLILR